VGAEPGGQQAHRTHGWLNPVITGQRHPGGGQHADSNSSGRRARVPISAAVAWRLILTTVACCAWIMSSSWAILINKHIMSTLNFPFPATVAALGMVGGPCHAPAPPGSSKGQSRPPLHARPVARAPAAQPALQVGSSIFSTIYVKVLGGVPVKQRAVISSRTYWAGVMPIGLCMAASFTTGNAAYMYLSGAHALLSRRPQPLA